jgi:15-hydroxyprostaglandin dehydrogenase (NAD)
MIPMSAGVAAITVEYHASYCRCLQYAVSQMLLQGGAAGIGLAFARALLVRGYCVAVLDVVGYREAEIALTTEHGIGRVIGIHCDVTCDKDLVAALHQVVHVFGSLTLMCNNAGIASPMFECIDKAVGINLTAVMKGTMIAKELMKDGGIIVNTASVAGLAPVDFTPVYAATKAGVVNFTRSLAWLGEAENIRVCAICPNFTDTSMVRSSLDDPSFSAIVASQPGGLLTPQRVAEALLYILDTPTLCGACVIVTAHKGIREVKFPVFGRPAALEAKL